jgi:hypothetical protein
VYVLVGVGVRRWLISCRSSSRWMVIRETSMYVRGWTLVIEIGVAVAVVAIAGDGNDGL